MAVTLQQIAERAGVSRGTVDRALNNRGRIRSEVAEEIKKIAKEMGYRPNWAGRALAMAKRSFRIGAILQEVETPFIQEMLRGIESAKAEIEHMGGVVYIKKIKGSDAKETIRAMEELRKKEVFAIALNPTKDERLKKMINRYVEDYRIPIVTMNSDMEGTSRLCYIGQNGWRCGATAAGLMKEIITGTGKIAVISGYEANPSVKSREQGFKDEMGVICPELEVLETRYALNDLALSETITREMLEQYQDLKGIFVAAHAEGGVCNVLEKEYPNRDIKVIAIDTLGDERTRVLNSKINFVIEQDAFLQGNEPVMTLFRLLFDGEEPACEYQYTDIIIRTKYNS